MKTFLASFLFFLLVYSSPLFSQTYATQFDNAENPLSDGGAWLNGKADGLDWYNIATYSGVAHGTNTVAQYSDPTAILKGTWTADQSAEATVYSVNPTGAYYQEVELRLRSTLTAHSCKGYEIFFRCLKTSEAYTQIVRWNGPLADFSYIADNRGAQYGVTHGDVVKATVVGNVITAYINGVKKAEATDNTFSSGNPGIGFNYGCNGTYADFGFADFSATGSGTGTEGGLRLTGPGGLWLEQNFPNPFKATTTLRYALPSSGKVTLKIYDLTGREIATLVNGTKASGIYTAILNGAKLAGGILTARLTADGLTQTRKLLRMN